MYESTIDRKYPLDIVRVLSTESPSPITPK
jgi:hypothetical protein